MKDFPWATFVIAYVFGAITGGIIAGTVLCHMILAGAFL